MWATRFFRPGFRTAARASTIPLTAPTARSFQTLRKRPIGRSQTEEWQRAFRRGQQTRQYRPAYNDQRVQTSKGLFRRWAAQPTFYYQVAGLATICGGFYVANCERVPVSGRIRFNVVSRETEIQMSRAALQDTLREYGGRIMPTESREHQMVQRVMNRLVPHSGLQDEQWEAHVINSPEANAFVIPGGKVFVFRGILDICQDDNGLAAVLGHEIAHNRARHVAERVSQGYALLPLAVLGFVVANIDFSISHTIFNLALQLPGSRRQEAEADHIGLLMMAESCYDPTAALKFWMRMEKAVQDRVPQFLSTHPSNHNRIGRIRGWLPVAQETFHMSGCGVTSGYADDFRRTLNQPQWT